MRTRIRVRMSMRTKIRMMMMMRRRKRRHRTKEEKEEDVVLDVKVRKQSSMRCRRQARDAALEADDLCGAAEAVGALVNPRCPDGGVQKVCTRNVTSLRRPFSCNTIVTNVEVQDTDFLDTPI